MFIMAAFSSSDLTTALMLRATTFSSKDIHEVWFNNYFILGLLKI